MIRKDNKALIPIILSAGDHDIGKNYKAGFTLSESQIKENTYLSLFPQNYPRELSSDGDE